jgi:hypothetical protein
MTGVLIGMNLKYLPWQLSLAVMFCLSIGCIYYAITISGKNKVVKIFFICCAIGSVTTFIESLAINMGILAQYLSIIKTLDWVVFFITIIVLFFFS